MSAGTTAADEHGDPVGGRPLYGLGRDSHTEVAVRRFRVIVVPTTVITLAAGAFLAPAATAAALFALATVGLLVRAAMQLWLLRSARAPADRLPPTLPDDALPSYTVLVPLFGEADVLAPLLRHLGRLDYPADRLEILLLCEASDPETTEAARALMPRDGRFRLVVCPDAPPRTKPRACNVGLTRTKGELCVIYDAEDRPELDQLRRAAEAFAVAGPDTVCLQAVLDFHNHAHNRLTRWFTVEYNSWFRLLLRGLVRGGMAVPLGGTSNHLRTAALRELGGWDAYNVTEDAELGIRLHALGHRTELVESATWEEACARGGPWIRQRTRWMKGFIQTWLTHAATTGGGAARTLHLVIGATVVANLAVPAAAIAAVLLLTRHSTPVLWSTASAWLAMAACGVAASLRSVGETRRRHLLAAALSMPVYQLLMTVATYRAVWQLVMSPHTWEKTPHGLSGADTDPAARE